MLRLGAASQAIANLQRHPELVINLASATMWDTVEAISGFTGRDAIPAHKAAQFAFSSDKFAVAGLSRVTSEKVAAVRVGECPIQLEAVVESMTPIADEPEGFAIVVTKIIVAHAHANILTEDGAAVDPERWNPLIFNFRTYHGLDVTLGTMQRAVRR